MPAPDKRPQREASRWAKLGDVAGPTRYAKTVDGVHVAYQVSGEGPVDVLVVPGFVSHVELAWDVSLFTGPLLRWLGRFARVIHFDKRGTGLSDRIVGAATLEQRMEDVRAVLDAASLERVSIVGVSEGGPMSLLFAATYPERTDSLVLIGSFARLSQAEDQPFGYPVGAAEQIADSFEEGWGSGSVLGAFFPVASVDPHMVEEMARYERNSASPDAIGQIIRLLKSIDVRPILSAISVPTLVVHSSGDPIVPVQCGRDLADRIPGARFLELPGLEHLPTRGPGIDDFGEVELFLAGRRTPPAAERALATILFTDIVSSTSRSAELGDALWRELLDRHDRILLELIGQHRGRAIKSTGDGVLAAFDGPARAVACGLAACDEARHLGITVRAGVHAGECEQRGDDLSGIAVHIAARICALAEPDEVLVSRTVTDLVAGSGLRFSERAGTSFAASPVASGCSSRR